MNNAIRMEITEVAQKKMDAEIEKSAKIMMEDIKRLASEKAVIDGYKLRIVLDRANQSYTRNF
jgi:hypothetical protein